ncbi:MAG: hypothetical protein RL662_2172 [Bacteroidota bacterium]|jgi:TatD DNase family protein
MIIDTHSHIYDESFDTDIVDVIDRAKRSDVAYILLPNVDTETIARVNNLAETYPNYCIPMMGLHPTSVSPHWAKDLEVIRKQFSTHNYIAVGEIGMDLYWDTTLKDEQAAAFEEQLRWSIELDLPVSIHCRNAVNETIDSINKVGASKLRGVFHSFGGNEDELQRAIALSNFYIGINGTVTYKNSNLPSILKLTDLSRLIIETDAPYLPPVPYRGKRNEPAYMTYIVEKLSAVFALPSHEIERMTTQNAKKLYALQ